MNNASLTPDVNSAAPEAFVDRRNATGSVPTAGVERRQFTNSHEELSPAARELALAIDGYKLRHRRRFITYEEMLAVIQQLGYHKDGLPSDSSAGG